MKFKVITQDKKTEFWAESAQNAVTNLRLASFQQEDTNQKYMKNYAQRCLLMFGLEIKTATEEEFFADLVDFGHLKITQNISYN